MHYVFIFFFQAEDGIRDDLVTGVQTCALPIPGHRTYIHTNAKGYDFVCDDIDNGC